MENQFKSILNYCESDTRNAVLGTIKSREVVNALDFIWDNAGAKFVLYSNDKGVVNGDKKDLLSEIVEKKLTAVLIDVDGLSFRFFNNGIWIQANMVR